MKHKATTKMPRKNTEFTERIKTLRESADMKQAQFAGALGVTRPLVSQCESGKKMPSTDLLVRLGNVAAKHQRFADAVWFWQQAGIAAEGMIPAALNMLEETKLGAPVGETTYIPYGLFTPGKSEKPRILWDSRLLQNPYYAKYLLTGRFLLVVDSQEIDLWKLIGSDVAVLQHPADVDSVEATRRELADYGLSRYPILEHARSDTPALYQGRLKTSPTEGATLLTLESQTSMGLTASQVVAVEIEARRGVHGKARIEVPYFSVLGRIVAWVDMGNKSLAPEKKAAVESSRNRPLEKGKRSKTTREAGKR